LCPPTGLASAVVTHSSAVPSCEADHSVKSKAYYKPGKKIFITPFQQNSHCDPVIGSIFLARREGAVLQCYQYLDYTYIMSNVISIVEI
jgi:hypothetical protein